MRDVVLNFSLFALALTVSLFIVSPQTRNILAPQDTQPDRNVLSTILFTANGEQYKVIKLQVDSTITVEIYKMLSAASYNLMAVFQIPNSRDVFYDLKSVPTNLFTTRLDNDDTQEIIVPTMDHNFVSHLNIIKFNSDTKTFAHHVL